MRINNNLMAINSYRQLGITNSAGAKAMEKLSSGLRINRAGDDAAGLAISEKMRGQIRGLTQASRNAQDGISLIQTAEGALNETHAILQRMRELAVQAATDTNTGVDRSEIQKEMNELIDEIDRIAEQTQFNELNLLDGTFTDKKFHIGANANQNIMLDINAMGSGTSLKTIDGSGEYTQGTDTVLGFENQTVLKDSNGDIAAVKLGDSWYAPNQVEVKTDTAIVLSDPNATPLTVETDQLVLNGELVYQDTDTVDGVPDVDVLKNVDGDIVAVDVEGVWYAPSDVEKDDTEDKIVVIGTPTPLTVADRWYSAWRCSCYEVYRGILRCI
ncbi:MAG: flagellin [Caldicoprobacterales bacterium]